MYDWSLIDLGDSEDDSLTQFFRRFYSDVAEEGSGHLAEERLGEIQPGAMHRSQNILETVRSCRQPRAGFLGKMRGVLSRIRRIVQPGG
jgi:hypothetical protein